MTGPPPLIEARRVSMSFPGVLALSEVDFDIHPGEVHALIGENGAGKSTLIKILSGEITGYEGEVRLEGRPVRLSSPRAAIEAGIAVIPQELLLVSTLAADENILLGREPRTRWGLIDRRSLRSVSESHLRSLGEAGLPDGPVGRLDGGKRQLVAIARALSLKARLLIMDEPTTSLGPVEVERLEQVVTDLAARGVAIIYISHRLDEVRRLASRVTVLRDGQRVATLSASGLVEPEMVRLMVGRTIERRELAPLAADAGELLRVEGLTVADPERPSGFRLKDITLTVGRGEIVGLSGLIGAGRSDFLLALVGAIDKRVEGRIRLSGGDYHPSDPSAARRAGFMLLPEDRKTQGIFPDLPVRANLTMSALERVSTAGIVRSAQEERASDDLMRQTGLKAASAAAPIVTLSGGNQQKAVLARCLFASPSVLLLDEPTRGIDLAAKSDVYELIRGLAARGYGIILCSSELTEILTLCHRVYVFREGRVVKTIDRRDATEELVLAAATLTGAGGAERPGASAPSTRVQAPPPADRSAAPPARRARGLGRFTSLVGFAAVVLLAVIFSPVRGGRLVFLDLGNLTDILRQVAEKGILAAGMTSVIISGGIDLSVGSVLALAATLTGLLLMHGGFGVFSTAVLVLLAGALVGLVNGAVTARWRIQPFIVTLATMSAARGVARYLSGGAAIPLGFGEGAAPESFRTLAAPIVPYVPAPALLFLLSVGAIHVLLARMSAGRYIYAIGDNEPAARLSGIKVGLYKVLVYVICGTLAALAGLIHCAQLEQGNPNDGVAYELDAIAAVVIGGTSLSGGVGTVGGTLVGTLIIGIINNSMGLNNIDANLQLILKGAIILGAVWLQSRRR
jgi:ABC-type sugar transport system ATPase subunit/ribose/xylose/arabinose/galactoside ABC-type transport system permease subunit